jgi:hypothetical protein
VCLYSAALALMLGGVVCGDVRARARGREKSAKDATSLSLCRWFCRTLTFGARGCRGQRREFTFRPQNFRNSIKVAAAAANSCNEADEESTMYAPRPAPLLRRLHSRRGTFATFHSPRVALSLLFHSNEADSVCLTPSLSLNYRRAFQ